MPTDYRSRGDSIDHFGFTAREFRSPRALGFPPLLLDLEAVQDTDHIIAVYRLAGHWDAIAKSHFSGLRCHAPVYRSLRELVMSYFEDDINLRGERTLRA